MQFTLAATTTITTTLSHTHTHTMHTRFLFRPFLARLFRGFNTGLHWLDTAVAVY